ncbi:hypothetical protein FACS1894172_08730 [Spirochaetia bacterium]|nr:hypothetical protein FACS1894164_12350 [Spirochaetia bacterium]GHU32323.1 hypothetical protein FACS1894172_08730 [Spirochaetia bacterium]
MKLLFSVIVGMMVALELCGAQTIFPYRVGDFEVFMLVESTGTSRPGILIGADDAQLQRYLPAGTYQSETNTFVIRTPDRILVIDTGFGGAIFDSLKTLNIGPEQVDAVLLTHLHGDHIGGLARNGQSLFPNATIYLSSAEQEYWTVTNPNQGAINALAPYKTRTTTFAPNQLNESRTSLFPGISAIAAFGHTPGHTMYLLESKGQTLLIWGDLMHVQDIQVPVPSISVTYDTDPAAAARIRTQVLQYAASTGIPVAGMHLVYPAIGGIRLENNTFRFSPSIQR